MRREVILTTLFCLCLSAASVARAADAERGKTLYVVCAQCHGEAGEGNQTLNAPKLAGQASWFIERQLLNFQKSIRGADPKDIYGMQMKPMSDTLDAAGVADVAAYMSGLPWVPSHYTITGDVEKGKLHFTTCTACHGPRGEGNEALNAPRIAGQEDWYLLRQLQSFINGIRGANPEDLYGVQMKPIIQTIAPDPADDTALRDLIAYIGTIE